MSGGAGASIFSCRIAGTWGMGVFAVVVLTRSADCQPRRDPHSGKYFAETFTESS